MFRQLAADLGRLQLRLQAKVLLFQFGHKQVVRRRLQWRPPERTRLQTIQRRLKHLAAHAMEHRFLNSQLFTDFGNAPLTGERFQDGF